MKNVRRIFKMIFTLCMIVGIGGVVFYFWKVNPGALDFLRPAYTISFDTGTEGVLEDITILSGKTISLPTLSREGYTFDGWYDGDKKWEENTKTTKSTTLKAKWIPNKYKITFVVDGEEYEIMCDYDSMPEFSNGTPEKDPTATKSYEFHGWYPSLSLVQGEARYDAIFIEVDRKFDVLPVANFEDACIFYCADKVVYGGDVTITVVANVGYQFFGWYMDDTPYGLDPTNTTVTITNVISDVHIEARFTLTAPPVSYGFYNSKAKFDAARTTKTIQINSETELVLWLEYVEFYDIHDDEDITINFGSGYEVLFATMEDMKVYIGTICDKCKFPSGPDIGFKSYQQYGQYILSSVYTTNNALDALYDADSSYTGTLEQYEYGLLNVSSDRTNEFDNFPYMARNKTIAVETSNQLVYALESGLKPVVEVGSVAETILNKAKGILRKICDDDMTNFQKIRAIYEWLILNVQYDHTAANTLSIFKNWQSYDSWYADGVFNKHKAVCDGISKALLILARIEEIPCVRVSGTMKSNDVGHAWNKVYIGGYWWGIDATHGDLAVDNSYEVLTYTSFLFTDAYKAVTCDFAVEADMETPEESRNVYADFDYTGFDLYIEDYIELGLFEAYLESYATTLNYYEGNTDDTHFTIEVAVVNDDIANALKAYITTRYGVNWYIGNSVASMQIYAFVLPKS